MTPRVHHAPRACTRCGRSFTPKRVPALYCGGGCRVASLRERRRVTDLGQRTNGASCNGSRAGAAADARLTAETRQLLKLAIDRRRRELLAAAINEDELAALRALFAEEQVEA